MKTKVGDKSYDGKFVPIMVILSNQDKKNIKNMLPHCTKYAVFPDSFGDKDRMFKWMGDEEK